MQPQAAATTATAVIAGASASSSSSSSSTGLMLRAPSPDFSTLSPEELDRLELVLRKQVEIENEQTQRLLGLRRTMMLLQQTIQHEPQRSRRTSSSNTSHNSSPNHHHQFVLSSSDIVQCYICCSTIDIQPNSSSISSPILCTDCHRPICRRCGNYTSPEFVQRPYGINLENQSHTSKWRCRMCIVRREVVRKSGSWNMNDNDTPSHSPVRLLNKLAAFRAAGTTPSNASSASPQTEHRTSILTESTNFFSRFWRSSTSSQPTTIMTTTNTQVTSSATLLASHEKQSASFDNLPEPSASPTPPTPPPLLTSSLPQEASVILSPSTSVNRRMSLIREVSSKSSVTPNPLDSSSLSMVPTISEPLQVQARLSSTVTDPSFEDTTSEHPYDTASEIFSQSLDTNVDSSNPGMADDQHDESKPDETPLSYEGRHRRLSSSSPMIQTSSLSQKHAVFNRRNIEQHHSESQPSTEADTDAMDYFSISMLANTSTEPIFMENTSASIDIPVAEHLSQRRSSRSTLRNAHSWAQRRSVMQRSCQWTATLERDNLNTYKDTIAGEHRTLNPIASLPASSTPTHGHEGSSSTPPHSPSPKSDSSSPIPSHILRRRRSSARRLPAIPADSIMQIDSSTFNDDLFNTSIPEYPIHPLRENSLSNRSTRSKSIDSESSAKTRSVHTKLLQTHQTQNAKSVDISNLNRRKSLLAVNENLLPQRSLDYPYIVRKAHDLSDIVRRRMLYTKINKQQQGENYSMSLEREHVPKVPRKIIIRQDNSIEIALSKPPKLRRQTLSEEYYYGYNADPEFGLSQTSNGSSMLGLPMSSSMSGSSNSDRRKTIETCENIYLHAEESSKLRARTPPANPHRILLHRDKGDTSIRTNGLGMRIIGGQECEDGSLGCFVTNVSPGGPADVQGNIEVGDQILEFNGNSLIDSTYEEVRMLQDQCGDIVQLVVQHNNIRFQINGGQTLSSIEVSRHFETVPRLSSSLTRKRRNLPPLPPSLSSTFPKQPKKQLYQTVETLEVPSVKELKPILINRGRLLAQIWHDVEDGKLALTVIQASNLPLRPNGDQPYTYITGKMIFEDRGFDMFETKVIHSSNPIYNETFVFHDVDTVDVLRLEILLWDRKQNNQNPTTTNLDLDENDEFIGMIQLPLNEANLDDEPRWYELRDRQARKPSATNVTFQSSSTERSDSFRKILPSSKPSKTSDNSRPSTDSILRTTNSSVTVPPNSRDISPKSILTNRKHSVIQTLNQPMHKRNLQRASIADPIGSSIQIINNHRQRSSNNDEAEEEEEEENIDKYRKGGKRTSIIAVQSEKLKRRISNGLLKLFDTGNKRASEGTLRLPSSPTGRKLSTQFQLNTDSDEENDSPIGITIDSANASNNKSPRHSILSTTNADDPQGSSSRSIPLHQMPIGQLMLPYIPSSRHSSISGSRKSSAASYCDSDDDIDRYFTFCEQERQQQDALAESNNVHTHTVGPGQVTPRNYENMINDFIHMGQIQLGLIVTKGLLEIDVISARALQKVIEETNNGATTIEDMPPDTYVKTYLRTGTRRVQKRKTSTIKANYNPEYHTKLKYNACNVMGNDVDRFQWIVDQHSFDLGRRLQVTVWQRARKFEKNQCIGEAFIQLDNLILTQLTVAWYKLFREKLVESEFYDSS